MGWSCRKEAGDVMHAWTEACVKQTGQSNVFEVGGQRYFWEVSNREHEDGAITGMVFRMLDETHARKSGGFRIEGDGQVFRAHTWLKAIRPTARQRGEYGIGGAR